MLAWVQQAHRGDGGGRAALAGSGSVGSVGEGGTNCTGAGKAHSVGQKVRRVGDERAHRSQVRHVACLPGGSKVDGRFLSIGKLWSLSSGRAQLPVV